MTSRAHRDHSLPPLTAGLVALLVFVAWPCLTSPRAEAQSGKPVVHVFLQVDAKSSVVEKSLQGRLPGLSITVFGRFRDFDEAANVAQPDAMLSITPVLEARGKKPALQGMRGGKGTEAYVLASV